MRSISSAWAVAISITAGAIAWFTFSRLSFTPVPWPDASAFYLPSLDLLSWPPRWRMHSQAAFVPSYDIANFNMMPLLPSILGIFTRLGLNELLTPSLALKFISLLALGAYALLLWHFARKTLLQNGWTGKTALLAASIIGLAALFDPILRWGTLVVRSETWIGLLWIIILLSQNNTWAIAISLAAGAYIHFEAIVLVPATIVLLATKPLNSWLRRVLTVGSKTALLMLPWAVYVLLHPALFAEQMQTQFGRLAHGNTWVSTAYGFFHSLFMSLGNAESWPKILNLGKGAFWLLIVALAAVTITHRKSRLIAATATAFATTLYLWVTKPELWFITLCHLTIWPWLAVSIAQYNGKMAKAARTTLLALAGLYLLVSVVATTIQNTRISPDYSWKNYNRWIDCIEDVINRAPGPVTKKIWQPHVPDVLVELSKRQPTWDLTRTMDFENSEMLAWNLTKTLDAIIFSRHFKRPQNNGETPEYRGPERHEDRKLLADGVESPFGPWALNRFPKEQPGRWRSEICHIGPFWAEILTTY